MTEQQTYASDAKGYVGIIEECIDNAAPSGEGKLEQVLLLAQSEASKATAAARYGDLAEGRGARNRAKAYANLACRLVGREQQS